MYICLITAIIKKKEKTEKEREKIKKEEGNDKVTEKRGGRECWEGGSMRERENSERERRGGDARKETRKCTVEYQVCVDVNIHSESTLTSLLCITSSHKSKHFTPHTESIINALLMVELINRQTQYSSKKPNFLTVG